MPVAISMLRGVNLGPHRRIKMEDLRKLYESLGLRDPRTFVQSGNVLFATEERSLSKVAKRIEDGIERRFGFRSDVIIRTAAELREVIRNNPFEGRAGIDPSKLLITFLADDPGDAARKTAAKMSTESEELHIRGRELYVYYSNGLARPKLSWANLEKILKTSGTGRNWNSVTKMLEMAEQLVTEPRPQGSGIDF